MLYEVITDLEMDPSFINRPVNAGFSGGEKKKNEILQMVLFDPKLIVLDETDSGLDIDALKTVAKGINSMRSPEKAIILITHYQRLLNYVALQPAQIGVGKLRQENQQDFGEQIEHGQRLV